MVSIIAHHNVLQLDVSVHNTKLMQVFQGNSNLEPELLNPLLRKLTASLLEVVKEIFTLHVFKDKEVVFIVLK